MKKIYLLTLGAVMISGANMAQDRLVPSLQQRQGKIVKSYDLDLNGLTEKGATTDTAGLIVGTGNFEPVFDFTAPIVYGSASGGYIYGFNADSICMTAQGYLNSGNSTVEVKEILMWVGGKDDAGVGTTLQVNLYDMAEGNAIVDFGTFDAQTGAGTGYGPGYSAKATETIAIANCDTAGFAFTSVPLTSPVSITGGFAIGINTFSWIDGNDTIGLVTDADGSGYNMAYQSSQPGYWWFTVEQGWGLNQNVALWAVIGDNDVSIGSDNYFNGMQLSAYPNPAVENTTIAFNLENKASDVVIKVMDSNGKVVSRVAKGSLPQGEYNEVLDVTSFPAGNYYYTLYSSLGKITKSFVVIK